MGASGFRLIQSCGWRLARGPGLDTSGAAITSNAPSTVQSIAANASCQTLGALRLQDTLKGGFPRLDVARRFQPVVGRISGESDGDCACDSENGTSCDGSQLLGR
jgi:hypothetical protein